MRPSHDPGEVGSMRFRDRTEAGARLAERLRRQDLHDPLVLAMPRGGVPVAFAVAQALDAPLEVLVARKAGAPGHPERGIGAVAEGGAVAVDRFALQMLGLSHDRSRRRPTSTHCSIGSAKPVLRDHNRSTGVRPSR